MAVSIEDMWSPENVTSRTLTVLTAPTQWSKIHTIRFHNLNSKHQYGSVWPPLKSHITELCMGVSSVDSVQLLYINYSYHYYVTSNLYLLTPSAFLKCIHYHYINCTVMYANGWKLYRNMILFSLLTVLRLTLHNLVGHRHNKISSVHFCRESNLTSIWNCGESCAWKHGSDLSHLQVH